MGKPQAASPRMATLSLYQLDEEYQALEMALLESGGEITEEMEARFDALFEATEEKGASYIAMIRKFEASAEGVGLEVTRLQAAERTFRNAAGRLKTRLRDSMLARGVSRLETRLGKINLQKAGGKAGVELLVEADDLPERFVRTTVTKAPDLDALRVALEAGDEAVGHLARLRERSRFVRIY